MITDIKYHEVTWIYVNIDVSLTTLYTNLTATSFEMEILNNTVKVIVISW